MDCEESCASAPTDGSEDNKKKNYKDKVYDLKFLKKKLPAYVNLTKSDDSSEVRRGLIGLKTILLSNSDGEHIFHALHSCGGLKQLVKLISSCTDQRQLGTLLCILHLVWNRIGNTVFRFEVLQSGFVTNLADILVKSSDEHNHLRALKLLNALSQLPVWSSKEFHNSGISKALVALLSQSQHSNVQIATIKTLRRLWSVEKKHGRVLELGSVKAVAAFLGTDNNVLLSNVLKTLVIFTNPCTISAAQQVMGKGDGYQMIVSKISKPVVSELICNLSRSPVGRIELTRAGIVPEIINQIKVKKYDKYLIMALCQMCQESMVRASLRATPCGFETFISLITNKAADQYHSDLLYALTYFIYDTLGLTMMVRAGLVDVLLDKLSDVADSMGSCHVETPPEVKATPTTEFIPLKVTSPTYSPSSPTYSCCSFETFSYPFATFDCENKKRRKENESGFSKSQDSCILGVLLHLVYQHTKLKKFALRETVDTILRYMTTFDFSKQESTFFKATKTLRAIVSCKHHFNKLLDDKTIMSIHQELCVKRHSNCIYCDKLYLSGQVILNEMSESSESALGEGEMAYRLTSDNPHMKTNVALTIPLIIKQPKLLRNLLLMHQGLDCLIKALDSHIENAVPALCSLMKTIGVSNPQQIDKSNSESEDIAMSGSSMEEESEEDVKFELDDGSAVSACKEKLVRNYPMFEAMFRGGFKEAGAETVKLPGVSAACLEALVCLDSANPSPSMLPSSVSTLLEMVSTSDRFLSPVLAENLLTHIVHRVLSPETSPEIYSWSVNTGFKLPFSAYMAVTTVSYLFTANIFFKDRVKAVREIINSPEKQHLFCDLNSIIIYGMQDYHDKVNRHSRYFMVSPKYILL